MSAIIAIEFLSANAHGNEKHDSAPKYNPWVRKNRGRTYASKSHRIVLQALTADDQPGSQFSILVPRCQWRGSII
jgi:hypothetical protein